MALPDRTQELYHRIGGVPLQVPVPLVLAGDLLGTAPRSGGEDVQEVRQAGLGRRVVADVAIGVGDRLSDLALDVGRIVEDADRPERRAHRLGHLAFRVLEVHDPGPHLGDGGVGDDEGGPEPLVEPLSQVTGQLEVLALIVADWHPLGVVQEDVGRHEDRIGEQPDPDVFLATPLVLELGHPAELAHGRRALQEPREPGVLGYLALDEDGAQRRVQSGGQEVHRRIESPLPQVLGLDLDGQGMEVDDAEVGVVLLLMGHPLPHGPQVVPQMHLARGLHARKYPGHGRQRYTAARTTPALVAGSSRCAIGEPADGMVGVVAYVVSTPVFEGPLDLLLHLVSSHQVDVLDVPLAPVVDAFVAALSERSGEMSMDQLSEFLLVAAILVELKSQRLLPGPDAVETDEELVGWEERDLLLSRLLECRAYAGIADTFVGMIEAAARSVPREAGLEEGFALHAPDLLAGVTVDHLAQAYLRATAERPAPRVDLSHVTVETVSVSETVQALVAVLPVRGATSFRDLTQGLTTKMEIIVHFLALLELCKRGKVSLGQGETFGDLRVAWIDDRRPLVGVLASGQSDGSGDFGAEDGDEYDG